MDYKKIYQSDSVANVGLIGTGAFGRSSLAQSRWIPGIRARMGCDQKIEVAAGGLLTCSMIEHEPKSGLWELRREQDRLFGPGD